MRSAEDVSIRDAEPHPRTTVERSCQECTARILIADDFCEWRGQVRRLLDPEAQWQVIGEASDGLEAVQKTAELCPDIVLLDIGMPSLNGIEAAKLIRQKSPHTKIVFLTLQRESTIIEAALEAGGAAYVLKTQAATELPAAITAALHTPQAAALFD